MDGNDACLLARLVLTVPFIVVEEATKLDSLLTVRSVLCSGGDESGLLVYWGAVYWLRIGFLRDSVCYTVTVVVVTRG